MGWLKIILTWIPVFIESIAEVRRKKRAQEADIKRKKLRLKETGRKPK